MSNSGRRSRTDRVLEAVTQVVCTRPWWVLAITAALTVAATGISVRDLRVHVDTDAMIASELPHLERWRDFIARHPLMARPLVVVIDGPPGDTMRAAGELADAMRAREDLFAEVQAPALDPFFRQHALLYRSPDELEELTDRLAGAQPLLGALTRDPSLHGLLEVLDRGVDRRRGAPAADAERLSHLLDGVRDEVERAQSGRAGGAALTDLAMGDSAADASDETLVLALTRAGTEGLNPAREAIDAIHAMAAERGLDADAGFRVRVTGDVALSADELELLNDNAIVTGVTSFVLVVGILWFGMRSPRLVIALCLMLLVGLAWTAGFATLAIGRLNMISVAFAVMSIGLGGDLGIHLGARHRELVTRGVDPVEAMRIAIADTGSSLINCAATTAVAFYAFIPTDFAGLAEFGWISGTGILLNLVATLVVLPALILVLDPRYPERPPGAPSRLLALLEYPQRRPVPVLVATGLLTLFALAELPRLGFSGNPLDLRAPDSESASAFRDLLARDGSTSWNLQVVGRSPEQARRLVTELEQLPVVARAMTVSDFVPRDQDRKREQIADLALFVAPVAPVFAASAPDQLAAAARGFGTDLECDERLAGADPVLESACRLRTALHQVIDEPEAGAPRHAVLARVEQRLVAPLVERMEALDSALRPEPVTFADLPEDLTRMWTGADGSWRVEVVPAGGLGSDSALAAFVDGVREVAPDVTGMGVNVVEAERVVERSLRTALVLSSLAIVVLLVVHWRRLGDVLRGLLPLTVACVWTLASAVLLGMQLNFANVIVLPLILGIGIDSGVHLVDRAASGTPPGELLRSSTMRAVALSSATTLASFGSLAFSPHPGMASMGTLLWLGLAFTLVTNLVVLPALLALGHVASDSAQESETADAAFARERVRSHAGRG